MPMPGACDDVDAIRLTVSPSQDESNNGCDFAVSEVVYRQEFVPVFVCKSARVYVGLLDQYLAGWYLFEQPNSVSATAW